MSCELAAQTRMAVGDTTGAYLATVKPIRPPPAPRPDDGTSAPLPERMPPGRRCRERDVDMVALEIDIRCGRYTLDELEAAYGVSRSTICRWAKKYQWRNDLAKVVKRVTRAKVLATLEPLVEPDAAAHLRRQDPAPQQPRPLVEADIELHAESQRQQQAQRAAGQVAAAAEVNKTVLLEHRKDITRLRNIVDGMMGELEVSGAPTSSQDLLALCRQMQQSLAEGDDAAREAIERTVAKIEALGDLGRRMLTAQRAASTLWRLQHLQRTALAMDDPEWQRPDDLADIGDDELERAIEEQEARIGRRQRTAWGR